MFIFGMSFRKQWQVLLTKTATMTGGGHSGVGVGVVPLCKGAATVTDAEDCFHSLEIEQADFTSFDSVNALRQYEAAMITRKPAFPQAESAEFHCFVIIAQQGGFGKGVHI